MIYIYIIIYSDISFFKASYTGVVLEGFPGQPRIVHSPWNCKCSQKSKVECLESRDGDVEMGKGQSGHEQEMR